MNNFDNVDLEYYGEDVYLTRNREFHEMQKKIQRFLTILADTMEADEYDKKSSTAADFLSDLREASKKIFFVKSNFDGEFNKIIISNRYIIFDYNIKRDDIDDDDFEIFNKFNKNKHIVKTVIIDKYNNDFNFISNKGDIYCDITSYNISKDGIKKDVYEQVDSISMASDETICESINEIKNMHQERKIAV